MHHRHVLLLTALLVTTVPTLLPARAAPEHGTTAVRNEDHRPPVQGRRAEPQGQIACGKYGCRRIPPNCHPEQGFDPWGNPTGHDVINCR